MNILTMNTQRINAVLRRHLSVTFRSLHRMLDLFYWPMLDFSIWAITSRWMQSSAGDGKDGNYQAMIMTAMVLWHMLFRTYMEVVFSLLIEIWNRNVVNLCTTPLTIAEWVVSVMILGFLKLGITFSFGSILIWLFTGTNIFNLGFSLVPFIALLAISGWTLGLIAAGVLIRWGKDAEVFTWSIGWLFAPVSAAFAPLAMLPTWLAYISKSLPMTYVFEAMRLQLTVGTYPGTYLIQSLLLNCVYFVIALCFFVMMFAHSRQRGLARLE